VRGDEGEETGIDGQGGGVVEGDGLDEAGVEMDTTTSPMLLSCVFTELIRPSESMLLELSWWSLSSTECDDPFLSDSLNILALASAYAFSRSVMFAFAFVRPPFDEPSFPLRLPLERLEELRFIIIIFFGDLRSEVVAVRC
jgi:hypothetical protein